MNIRFLGVGEACDPAHGNTAVLVSGTGGEILLDCGFTVPHNYFAATDAPDQLDAVYLSHFHGDHFFGMPLLLLRFWEMGRQRELTVISQPDGEEKVLAALDLAYPGFFGKLQFPLRFLPIEPGHELPFAGFVLRTAETMHSRRNLGLRLDDGPASLYYSGDGRATAAVQQLAQGVDLMIHEAFRMEDSVANHGSVQSSLHLAATCGARRLALVHLERHTRRDRQRALQELLSCHPRLHLPEDGMTMDVATISQEK